MNNFRDALLITLMDAAPLLFFLFTLLVIKGAWRMIRLAVSDIYRWRTEAGEDPGRFITTLHRYLGEHRKPEDYEL